MLSRWCEGKSVPSFCSRLFITFCRYSCTIFITFCRHSCTISIKWDQFDFTDIPTSTRKPGSVSAGVNQILLPYLIPTSGIGVAIVVMPSLQPLIWFLFNNWMSCLITSSHYFWSSVIFIVFPQIDWVGVAIQNVPYQRSSYNFTLQERLENTSLLCNLMRCMSHRSVSHPPCSSR